MSGYTIQELTAGYKDWMSSDGCIFDAEYSHLDQFLPEERPHIGYIIQSIYVKPTTPPLHATQLGRRHRLRLRPLVPAGFFVPGTGLEPVPSCKEGGLSPPRLPFRHPGQCD